ncbi:hypothetical protein B484DRAFT_444761 [Ochromonadaceae sp. CCMP2298]|nr:hypothetical protein B484DRAFT_444761 [Ochromonadaceae sp. CCMP2298]
MAEVAPHPFTTIEPNIGEACAPICTNVHPYAPICARICTHMHQCAPMCARICARICVSPPRTPHRP